MEELTVTENGTIPGGNKIVIPVTLRKRIVQLAQEGPFWNGEDQKFKKCGFLKHLIFKASVFIFSSH